MLQEVAGGELGAAHVVGDHGDVVDGVGPPVQQDDPGVPRLYLTGGGLARALADQDQAGDPHTEEGAEVVDLALVEVVGVADQDHLSALGRGLFHGVRHLREEGLPGVGHDHADEVGAPGRHRLRDPVGPVAQLLDRGEYPLSGGRGDRPGSVVDHVAHDGGRCPRQSRHVVPRHLGHGGSLRGSRPLPKGCPPFNTGPGHPSARLPGPPCGTAGRRAEYGRDHGAGRLRAWPPPSP